MDQVREEAIGWTLSLDDIHHPQELLTTELEDWYFLTHPNGKLTMTLLTIVIINAPFCPLSPPP